MEASTAIKTVLGVENWGQTVYMALCTRSIKKQSVDFHYFFSNVLEHYGLF